MKWGLWSTTASSNSATPPDGWPEGQAPSTVNDCAREMMASIRTGMQDMQFIDQGDSPTFVSSTKFSVPGNLTASYQIGRRLKLNDATTLYATITDASGSAASTTVTARLDSGVLTSSLSSIGVAILSPQNYSIPDIGFKNQNVLVNPYVDTWNGPTSFVNPANGQTLLADMFKLGMSMTATMAINITRSNRNVSASNVPTLAQAGLLLDNSICISVSAAVASVAAGQFMYVDTRIEGINWRPLAQKPTAFQFWVKSNRTGTYCLAAQNSTANQTYLSEFSISSTSWERKTFTLPASPSAGSWDYSTGLGLALRITLACGSSFQGGAGNWTATNVIATSNQINFVSSAGNTIRLAGFQFQEGIQCGPLVPKNITDDKLQCQRYRPSFGDDTSGNKALANGQVVIASSTALVTLPFQVESRVAPTGFNYNGNTTAALCLSGATNGLNQVSAVAAGSSGKNSMLVTVTIAGGTGLGAAGQATYLALVPGTSVYLTGAEL